VAVMMAGMAPLRLGRVPSLSFRVGVSVFWAVMLAGSVVVIGVVVGADETSISGMLCGLSTGLAGVALSAGGLISTWRDAAWLDGTVLIVHSVLATHVVDLATAKVRGEVNFGYKKSVSVELKAVDAVTGRTTSLRLGDRSGLGLTPAQVIALAEAIESGPDDDDARRVAARLRLYVRGLPNSQARWLWTDPPAP